MRFQAPRGAEDVLPVDSHRWRKVESTFRETVELYGYKEIRTPTFEDVQLFLRTAGETSEVVSKQMYDFVDKGGRHIALKAEGTAPAMRAMIEHGLLQQGAIHKLYYNTPVFRYERPQKGRLREHHQIGIELIGSSAPEADVEVIEIAVRFYQSLGLKNFEVLVNSIGRSECRQRYQLALLAFAEPWLAKQDDEAQRKAALNPMRLLDSKDPELQDFLKSAPIILDFLEADSKSRFERLQTLLADAKIDFQIDPRIVRGLDYYTEMVFELQISTIGAQSAIGGGGRYDGLIEQLGGPPTPSVGFGIGLERALLALESEGIEWDERRPIAYVVAASEQHLGRTHELTRSLRRHGMETLCDYDGRSMKSQLKQADRLRCRYAVIIGDDEVRADKYTLRNLETSQQELVGIEAIMSLGKS